MPSRFPALPLAAFFADAFFSPLAPEVDALATGAKVRFVVTGHGQAPNTKEAAEFLPARRWLTVAGTEFENLLWRTDCWLNPCRPQGGTWKYDRAGWAPGALVLPWDVDVTARMIPGEPLPLRYRVEPYENEKKSGATHWVASQLFLYRDAPVELR